MEKTYLYKVYSYDRKMFFSLLFFAVATLLCNLGGLEITPFFVWSMYSKPEQPEQQYDILLTKTGDSTAIDPSAGYTDDTRFYLNSPLALYKATRDNANADPTLSFLQSKLHGRLAPLTSYPPLVHKLFNDGPQLAAFPHWYRRYLEEVTGHQKQDLSLSVVRVHFDANSHIIVDSTFLSDTWRKP